MQIAETPRRKFPAIENFNITTRVRRVDARSLPREHAEIGGRGPREHNETKERVKGGQDAQGHTERRGDCGTYGN